MLCLYLQAPFGVSRTFTAGSFRPTAEFVSYSAIYGLLLNVAGIEMRHDDGESVMTLIKPNLPKFRLALGALSFPLQHSIYQQLHNYRVGENDKIDDPAKPGMKITLKEEGQRRCKGSKYNVTPARRAFLSDIRAYIALEADGKFECHLLAGLKGESSRTYGLPFLGDNSFLLDKLAKVEQPEPAYWYVPVLPDTAGGLRERVTRLTLTIDRADMSRTTSALFAPTEQPTTEIPAQAWVTVGY
ncbi:MAG: CRISPR-associated protein Cas5 [candidate division WOR-3 bacterium]|nr:CRISPR-associated protein Cas5 [candidate division WOR-3 bacterium]